MPTAVPTVPPAPTASSTATAQAVPASPPEPPSVPAKRIALDRHGGCAVLVDGGVSCWGGRFSSAPRRLPGVTDAVDVSLGRDRDDLGDLAVVRADGTVVVFPSRHGRKTALPLSLRGVKALSQALGSACGLFEGGKVACWPKGIRDRKTGAEVAPVEVKGLGEATSVSVGGIQACALLKDGTVACWEMGARGNKPPVVVGGLANVVEVHAGPLAACAREASRKVSCFRLGPKPGALVPVGEADALGFVQYAGDAPLVCRAGSDGIQCERPDPFMGAHSLPSLGNGKVSGSEGLAVKQIAVANFAACALDDKGIVRCWGQNQGGVLGQPDAGRVEDLTVVPGLPPLKSIGVGSRFTCGLSTAGDVHCWGQSGGKEDEPRDGAITKVPGMSQMERLITSWSYACGFNAAGEATCVRANVWKGDTYSPSRVRALDGVREVLFPYDQGPVAAIGRSGELLAGWITSPKSLLELTLDTVKDVGPVRLLDVHSNNHDTPKYNALVVDEKGRAMTLPLDWDKTGRKKLLKELDGALELNDLGLAVLPGGKVRPVPGLEEGRPVTLASSPFVSLVDTEPPCGTTADGKFGCLEEGDLTILIEGQKQISATALHQCAVDDAGVARCRGNNSYGQCGPSKGVFRSAQPAEVRLR